MAPKKTKRSGDDQPGSLQYLRANGPYTDEELNDHSGTLLAGKEVPNSVKECEDELNIIKTRLDFTFRSGGGMPRGVWHDRSEVLRERIGCLRTNTQLVPQGYPLQPPHSAQQNSFHYQQHQTQTPHASLYQPPTGASGYQQVYQQGPQGYMQPPQHFPLQNISQDQQSDTQMHYPSFNQQPTQRYTVTQYDQTFQGHMPPLQQSSHKRTPQENPFQQEQEDAGSEDGDGCDHHLGRPDRECRRGACRKRIHKEENHGGNYLDCLTCKAKLGWT
ncbi:hypothetical protein BCR34DRAFT_583830 [Clohesyomyces aquaticus]|uniref:Uncharacterized protein n=1 Tax=Clohesyomyces aquaticus TaxID=1231657 RepID=A0A1Y2A3G3_9PLEO|nr:hypothetical protein BCR34DRAFT_583830 [Clohesyomyces aquaticus]